MGHAHVFPLWGVYLYHPFANAGDFEDLAVLQFATSRMLSAV